MEALLVVFLPDILIPRRLSIFSLFFFNNLEKSCVLHDLVFTFALFIQCRILFYMLICQLLYVFWVIMVCLRVFFADDDSGVLPSGKGWCIHSNPHFLTRALFIECLKLSHLVLQEVVARSNLAGCLTLCRSLLSVVGRVGSWKTMGSRPASVRPQSSRSTLLIADKAVKANVSHRDFKAEADAQGEILQQLGAIQSRVKQVCLQDSLNWNVHAC